jgi:tetratricopeptide (TPR) repeat protein
VRRDSQVSDPTRDPGANGNRLESWKEIAAYLKRHVTTVRRWERKEGLPVHRHLHDKLGSIYAFSKELDRWLDTRPETSHLVSGSSSSRESPTGSLRSPFVPPPAVPASSMEFCGRDAELETLSAAWDVACRRGQQLVFVTGEPGIGKTRLALGFAHSLPFAATVLVGHCDKEALWPFAPFVEILRSLLESCPAAALEPWLADIEGIAELAEFVPELVSRLKPASVSFPSNADGRRYRMFEALTQLIHAASQSSPILLVLEDLHWADRASVLLLRHLLRSPREAAICYLITYCDTELQRTPELREIVADLRRELSATRIVLNGLSEDHVHRMVTSSVGRSGTPHLAQVVAKSTKGNPLFISEVLRHLNETGALPRLEKLGPRATVADVGVPEGISELIGRRLSHLSAGCLRLLTLASVIGYEFNVETVEGLAGTPEDVVLDGLDEAVAATIIYETAAPGRFSFVHPLIRETLYTGQTAARRQHLHHRIAGVLEGRCSSAKQLGELAYHFSQGAARGGARRAVDYGVRAGEHAASALALEQAARYYGMALHALDFLPQDDEALEMRFELHNRSGRSYFQIGHWEAAKQEFETALTFLDSHREVNLCELLLNLAETSFWLMDVPSVRLFATQAQELADRIGRDDLWADALAWLGSAEVADGNLRGAVETDRLALARSGAIRSFGLARIPLTLYWAGRTREAVNQAAQAVEHARGSEDPALLLYALQHWGLTLSGAGRYDEALRAFDEACTFGRCCGAFPLLARATSMSAAPLLSLGDLDGATMRALEARELAHRVAFEPPLVSAGIDLLLISARSDDPGRAEALLHQIVPAVEKASGWHAWKWRMRLSQADAELALARGSWSEAQVMAGLVLEQSRSRGRLKYEALGLATLSRALHGRGSRQAATEAVRAVRVARRLGDPAVLLDCLAILLEIEGSDELLAEARATVQRILEGLSQEPFRSRFVASVSSIFLPSLSIERAERRALLTRNY